MTAQKFLYSLAVSSLAACVFTVPVAAAQGANGGGPTEDAGTLQEVVVTAQKRKQSEMDVPISMAVLNGGQLAQGGLTNLTDLAAVVPSLEITDRGGGGSRYVFLRGLSSIEGSTPLVGTYVDEADVTGFPGLALDLQTNDLKRVEVLRGPQGTLYGVGSAGGVIRFITNDPDLSAFGGELGVSWEDTRGGGQSERVQTVLNAPVVSQQLGLRISAVYDDDGGWINQPALGRRNINDDRLLNVRTKVLWKPTDSTDVRAMAIVYRNRAGAPGTGEDGQGNYAQAFDSPTTPSGTFDYDVFNLTVDQKIGSLNLLSTSTYMDLDREQEDVGYRVPFGSTPDLLYHALFSQSSLAHSFTQELRLTSDTSASFKWLMGAFYRNAGYHENEPNFEFGPIDAPFFFSIDTLQNTRSWALFGNASMAFGRLEAGVGARYFHDQQGATDFIADQQGTATFTNVSPRAFLRYRLGKAAMLYSSISRGFRSGGLIGGLGLQGYAPDTLWTYELGAKGTFFNGRVNTDNAIFYTDYKGVQVDSVYLVDGTLQQYTANAGQAHIKGIDWQVSWRLADPVSLGFAGELIDARFVAINALAASHAVGDPLDDIPKYHYSFWTEYRYKWATGIPGFARIDFTQVGPEQYTNRTVYEGYIGHSDRISMLSGTIGADFGAWTASLYVKNLLNDRGFVDAETNEDIAARARPRTVGIRFDTQF